MFKKLVYKIRLKRHSSSFFWKQFFICKDFIQRIFGPIYYFLSKLSCRYLPFLIKKQVLKSVTFHLVDHCNLNCKGCAHFSPIADKWFVKMENLCADLKRLSQLFSNIKDIWLLGGEPLLHPDVKEIAVLTRKFFPNANIFILTNGLLLHNMDSAFLDACRDNYIKIFIARYKINVDFEKIRTMVANYKVELFITDEIDEFVASRNLKGDSDPVEAMKVCRSRCYIAFLQNGKIYPCPTSALAHYFNSKFNAALPVNGVIDIYKRTTGGEIIDALDKPIPMCRYCATRYRPFKWGISRHTIDEWVA